MALTSIVRSTSEIAGKLKVAAFFVTVCISVLFSIIVVVLLISYDKVNEKTVELPVLGLSYLMLFMSNNLFQNEFIAPVTR